MASYLSGGRRWPNFYLRTIQSVILFSLRVIRGPSIYFIQLLQQILINRYSYELAQVIEKLLGPKLPNSGPFGTCF